MSIAGAFCTPLLRGPSSVTALPALRTKCASGGARKVDVIIPSPTAKGPATPLRKGQLWKTDAGDIQIWHTGKGLIDYRMMPEPGKKALRTQATGMNRREEYLKAQKVVLANASPA